MERMMTKQRVVVAEPREEDLPFLLELWHTPKVMRYGDAFLRPRGWSESDDLRVAWAKYQEKRAALGSGYTQLMLRLADGTPVGESFLTPLPEGHTLGEWKTPEDIVCLMGDTMLIPEYRGHGFGSEGMQQVVEWLFGNTICSLLLVPPHRRNPAAQRVYEKAGSVA